MANTHKSKSATPDAAPATAAVEPVVAAVEAGIAATGAAVEQGLDAAAAHFDKSVEVTREQVADAAAKVETGTKRVVGQAKANFERAADWSRKHLATVRDGYKEALAFSHETAGDLTAAGKAASTGAKAVGEALVSFAKATGEANVDAVRKLFKAKSLSDVVTLQGLYTKTALEVYVAHATRINQTAADAVRQLAEPLHHRLAAVASKVDKSRVAA